MTQNVTQRILGCDSEGTGMRFRGYWDVTQRVLGCDQECDSEGTGM